MSLQVVYDCSLTLASVACLLSRTGCFYSERQSHLKDFGALSVWQPAALFSTVVLCPLAVVEPLVSCSPPGSHLVFSG